MRRSLFPTALAALISCLSGAAWGDEVPRNPPAIYAEKLEALLTPLDKVLAKKHTFTSADGPGVVLLDEEIDYVDEQGRLFNVEHCVYEALTEDGCKEIATGTFYFRRLDQKISLVTAQTILPDGTRIPIRPDATFIKSPQDEASNSLYDDGRELLIMLPNINVGAITESIVVTEQPTPRLPGEFTRRFSWYHGWPSMETRWLVDLPTAVAERVQITNQGEKQHDLTRSVPDENRSRFVWMMGRQPASFWEENMPPNYQVEPYTWLSTVKDWDVIARWYAGLLKDKDTLNPELAKQVDAWTKDAKTPWEIIDILTGKVSRDVRYVGLEFGIAGFQPANCNTVWANRYGDCKDKANLLRSMLLYKGIPARMAFLSTENSGRIEKRSPDYRQFDHVILTAEYEPGKWVFCDPTIRFGHVGLISPADADREAMVLDGEKYEWIRTPPAEAGELTYQFDVKRDARGDLSGWLVFRADGYYASAYRARYLGKDHDDMVRTIGESLRGFFPAAEIVDVKADEKKEADTGFQYDAYFVVPSDGDSASTSSATFPFNSGLLPDVGADGKRATPWYQWRDVVEVKYHLQLPPGIKASSLPSPYQITVPSLDAEAGWSAGKDGINGRLLVHIKDSFVTPSEFAVFKNSVRSLQTWLDRPLLLAAGTGDAEPQPAETPKDVTLENFPMMPTSEGQRTLLEKRFPSESNRELRRKALAKILQYFPRDKSIQFYTGINLAFMDAEEKKPGAAPAIEKLIDTHRSALEAWWISWAEYRLAFLCLDLNEPEKARVLFDRIARDESGGEVRRAWSAYHAANLNSKKAPAEAIAMLREGIKLDTDALTYQLPLLARLLNEQGHIDELREPLAEIATRKSPASENGLVKLAEFSGTLPEEQGEKLRTLVSDAAGTEDEALTQAIKTARTKSSWTMIWLGLQGDLKKYLTEHPQPGDPTPEKSSQESLQKEITMALDAQQTERSLALTLALLTQFPPQEDFPQLLWKACARAEWIEKINGVRSAGPILPYLLELGGKIPKANDYYYEVQILKARVLGRGGDDKAAEAILTATLAEPEFPESFEKSFRRDLGACYERQGKYEDALRTYLPLNTKIGDTSAVSDLMLKAVFLRLHFDRYDEAIALLQRLDKVKPSIAQKADYAFQIGGMVRLARQPESARKYWASTKSWKTTWQAIAARLAPDGKAPDFVVVPIVADLSSLGEEMGQATRAQNKALYLKDWNLLVSAALWDPGMVIEAGSLRTSACTLYSDLCADILNFICPMLETIPAESPDARNRDVVLAAAYCDKEEPEKCIEIAHRFLADGKQDELNFTMRRLLGFAAYTKTSERAAAIASLEECLALPDATPGRIYAVRILGRLYSLEGRLGDEEKLLERELKHPRIKAAEQYGELQERYKALTAGKSADQQFSHFITEWMPKYQPAWFDYAHPAKGESQFGDLASVLDSPDSYFSPLEAIKFLLLTAQDEKLEYLQRANAWDTACLRLADLLLLQKQTDEFYASIYGSDLLSENVRSRWLWIALFDAGTHFQPERFESCLKSPLTKPFNAIQREGIAAFKLSVSADLFSIKSIEEAFTALGRKPLCQVAIVQAQALFSAALRLGEIDAAQRMYDRFGKFSFTQDVTQTHPSLSLEFLKTLKQARRWCPMQDALRAAALNHFPADEIKRPANYGDLRFVTNSELLTVPNATAIRLYQILTRQIAPEDLSFWTDFVRGLGKTADFSLRMDLAKVMVEHAPDDQAKALSVMMAGNLLDTDDPAERKAYVDLYAPFRDAAKSPQAAKIARLMDGRIAYRTGDAATYEDLILKNGAAHGLVKTDQLALKFYLQQNNEEQLKLTIDQMKIDNLVAPENLITALPALTRAGMEDEASLAREAGRKELYKLILDAWARPSNASLSDSFDLANVLAEPALIPEKWMTDMTELIQCEPARSRLLINIARTKGDWKEVERLTSQLITNYPALYYLYWLRGEALYHLEQTDEALAALKIYTTYARDEPDYPKALEWISALEKARTQP